jgi:hypothetical protein
MWAQCSSGTFGGSGGGADAGDDGAANPFAPEAVRAAIESQPSVCACGDDVERNKLT